jgi:hypothetical protein
MFVVHSLEEGLRAVAATLLALSLSGCCCGGPEEGLSPGWGRLMGGKASASVAASSGEVLEEAVASARQRAVQGGSALGDLDDLVLMPVLMPGLGLGLSSSACEFEEDPFGTCI